VGNAVKFTHKGYIKLTVHQSFATEDQRSINLVFTVEDTGIGIPADQQGSIFDAFMQQKNRTRINTGEPGWD